MIESFVIKCIKKHFELNIKQVRCPGHSTGKEKNSRLEKNSKRSRREYHEHRSRNGIELALKVRVNVCWVVSKIIARKQNNLMILCLICDLGKK